MIRRFRSLLHWLVTGENVGLFPVPPKPEVPKVNLEVKPDFHVEVIKPAIPSEHDAVLNAASTLVAGSIARGGHPDLQDNVERALELHRRVHAQLEKQ